MPTEIERKFKVFDNKLPELSNGKHFIQGYISQDPQVRFRICDNEAILCVKKEIAIGIRTEIEFPKVISNPEEIEELYKIAMDPPLEKTRYKVKHEDLIWEIDVYEGLNKGLIVAEVELPSIDHPIEFPDWIDHQNEISHDERYANIHLTRHPYQNWKEQVNA